MRANAVVYDKHNKIQRHYYERRTRRENWRMVPNASPYVENHVERLIHEIGLDKADQVLDVGCGMGKFTIPLADRGYQVEGLDLSPYLLDQLTAANAGGRAIPVHCADILCPPETLKRRYHAVSGFFMLHHLVNLEIAFKRIGELLKTGGRIGFIDVNPLCALYYLQIFLSPTMRWKAEKGMVHLNDRNIEKSLIQAGFSNIRIGNYGILPPPLKNHPLGGWLESRFDRIGLLKPFAAFKWITATQL